MKKQHVTFALLTILFTQSGYTANGANNGHRGPPPEAIDACASQSEGDSCSFAGRDDQQLSGVCFTPPDRDTLACKPEGHDDRGKGGQGNSRAGEQGPG